MSTNAEQVSRFAPTTFLTTAMCMTAKQPLAWRPLGRMDSGQLGHCPPCGRVRYAMGSADEAFPLTRWTLWRMVASCSGRCERLVRRSISAT